uniref:Uncharacterized protein n=1 Tax=uncultured prokaryote TaxID=198431 RepID=H5S952_9ZZZZ|nr:hypothetical protein HGMM_F03A04C11 [uncultured prokaryote]
MLKVLLVLLILAVVIPVLAGVPLPHSLDPQAIGHFLQQVIAYWVTVFEAAARRH